MNRPKGIVGALVLTSVMVIAAACDDENPVGPTLVAQSDLVGNYVASTLTTTVAGVATDHLGEGASLTLAFSADGSTSGRLFVPEGDDGADLDVDLTGTWAFDAANQTVTFDMTADSFLRDATFAAERSGASVQLQSSETFDELTIDTVLDQI